LVFLRSCSVLRAYPVRALPTEDDGINVETDPEDEWRARQRAATDGLR
jgi:hypothetical protein